MFKRCAFLLLLLAVLLPTAASRFVPVVRSFSPPDYNAALQNWSVTQGANGEIYIGNGAGVLRYDGRWWQLFPLPGNGVARSMYYTRGRLYVGTYENFGYMEPDRFGNLHFVSLWDRLKGYKARNDEIWKIMETPDGRVIFQSFCSWFEFNGREVKAHYSPSFLPLYFFPVHGKTYVQRIDGGFGLLQGTTYTELLTPDRLGNTNVVQALPLKGGSLLLVTEFGGLFRFNGNTVEHQSVEQEERLVKAQANRAVLIPRDSTIVVGTIRDGVFGYNRQGRLLWHYNMQNHLGNNTVLGLFTDRESNVWVALDAGVAVIGTGSAYTLMSESDAPLGTVYDVYEVPQGMYICTNQATWFQSAAGRRSIIGTEGQNWHITRFGNRLIVGNNHGTKVINGTTATLLPGSGASSSTAIRRYMVNDSHDYLVESGYADLRIYRNVNGEWQFQNTVEGFMAPVSQFEIAANGVIWAAHMSRGLYRIELSEDMRRVAKLTFYPSVGKSKEDHFFHVVKINGDIVVAEGNRLYTVDNGRFTPYTALNGRLQGQLVSVTSVSANSFWVATDKGYHFFTAVRGRFVSRVYVPAAFFGLYCGDKTNTVRVFGNHAYFCMYGGVGRLDMRRLTTDTSPTFPLKLTLQTAYYHSADKQKHFLPVDGSEADAYGDVVLRYAWPLFAAQPVRYRFHIKGGGFNQTLEDDAPELVLNTPGYGTCHIVAEVLDRDGKVLSTLATDIHFPRPFYLSFPMLMVYALLLLLTVWIVVKWRTRKVLEQQKKVAAEEQMRQSVQLAEQKRIIAEQERLLLEERLQAQGKEILSLSMSKALAEKGTADDKYWELYQENFDLIHEHFFRRLRETYPSLTPTDLKFCALLRLNLSSKDIARFTGLTVRGVEGARYRLRKKLQLPETVNLAEFFIDFR